MKRGVPPAFVAVGLAAGIAIGFFGGRVTAPRGAGLAAPSPALAAASATPRMSEPEREIAVAAAATPVDVASETPASTLPATSEATTPTATPAPAREKVALVPSTPTPRPAARATAAPKTGPSAGSPPALARASRAVEASLADALALEKAGKSSEAISTLEVIVKSDPANADAIWALASAYRAKKLGPKACPRYRAYVKHAPKGSHAAEAKRHLDICRAVTLLDQEKLPEATAAFAAIVRANWTFPDGHYWLGTMQSLNNEAPAACSSFKSYLRLDGKGPYVDRATAQLAALGC